MIFIAFIFSDFAPIKRAQMELIDVWLEGL